MSKTLNLLNYDKEILSKDGIYILTKDPSLNITNNEQPKYVGYDHIGELYSGVNHVFKLSEEYILLAKKIKELYGKENTLLDLGCGDGLVTVPFAKEGFKVIAGDISTRMLKLLQEKAKHNNVSLKNTFVCRLNALDIPFVDKSIDIVTAREMLHLISEPLKVMDEIHRILKKGGKYLLLTNSPHYKSSNQTFDNQLSNEILTYFQSQYWEEINKRTKPDNSKFSWQFNQEEAADSYFSHKDKILIKAGGEVIEDNLKYFFDRYRGKAYSNLAGIDDEIHNQVYDEILNHCFKLYGDDFISRVKTKYFSSNFYATIYTK